MVFAPSSTTVFGECHGVYNNELLEEASICRSRMVTAAQLQERYLWTMLLVPRNPLRLVLLLLYRAHRNGVLISFDRLLLFWMFHHRPIFPISQLLSRTTLCTLEFVPRSLQTMGNIRHISFIIFWVLVSLRTRGIRNS